MATVNKRVMKPQAHIINGVSNGGLVSARIQTGYDDIRQNPVDGLSFPIIDRVTEFVRGSITTQDWVHLIELLTGTVGTSVIYERQSGVAEATGYTKHTLTNPVIHRVRLSLTHRDYATVAADFECKAADEDKGILDMWTPLAGQTPPTYVSAARGLEITACAHGALSIYHVTRLDFEIVFKLAKASQDGDKGYTAVDVIYCEIAPSGTLVLQDSSVTTGKLMVQQLVTAEVGDLVLTVKQAQGASAKTLTIANVLFGSGEENSSPQADYSEISVPFVVTNDADTPLTLEGANKIIAIT